MRGLESSQEELKTWKHQIEGLQQENATLKKDLLKCRSLLEDSIHQSRFVIDNSIKYANTLKKKS